MKSVKQLQDAANKERAQAESARKESQQFRDKANNHKVSEDRQRQLEESEQAQSAEERAQQHEKIASDLVRESAIIEEKAVTIDRDIQTKQVAMQSEIDRLSNEAKKLRGE